MVVYLLLGAVGMPVFSGFRGGMGVLLDTTGGYIIGFVAAALVYWLVTARLGESLPVSAAACVLGLAVCYAFGTAWFLVLYARTTGPIGVTTALGWCVIPYIIPDLLKLALALLLSGKVKKFLKYKTQHGKQEHPLASRVMVCPASIPQYPAAYSPKSCIRRPAYWWRQTPRLSAAGWWSC